MSENLSYCLDIIRNTISTYKRADSIPSFSVDSMLMRLSQMNFSAKVRSYSETRIFLQPFNLYSTNYYLQIVISTDKREAIFFLNNHFFHLPNEDAAFSVLEALYSDNIILEIQRRHAEREKIRIKNKRLVRLQQMYKESKLDGVWK